MCVIFRGANCVTDRCLVLAKTGEKTVKKQHRSLIWRESI
jgi:hypothetical protein